MNRMTQEEREILGAVRIGNIPKLEELVEKGISVSIANNRGMTPLHLASSLGLEEMVEKLIELGANYNAISHAQDYGTPLDVAERYRHHRIAQMLRNIGARNNAPEIFGGINP